VDPDDLRAVIAQNIRVIAERKKMVLEKLADFAGVSRAQLFNVLACTSSPSSDWLARVAEPLEVEAWELLVPRTGASGRPRPKTTKRVETRGRKPGVAA